MRIIRSRKRPAGSIQRIYLIDGVGVPLSVYRRNQAFGEYGGARFEMAERWSKK